MENQGISFRSSLVILIDEEGQNIYKHLFSTTLLDQLALAVQQHIIFVHTTRTGLVRSWLASEAKEKGGQELEGQKHTIDTYIHEAFIQTNTDTKSQEDEQLQIYIVAHAGSPMLQPVLQDIQNGRGNAYIEISCILCVDNKTPLPLLTGIKFCYVYGGAPGATYSEEDIYYAAAEGLFALIGTDIATKKEFQVHQQVTLDDSISPYRTLSSCLITFPYAMIESYSSAFMSYTLLERWLDGIQRQRQSGQKNVALHKLDTSSIEEALSNVENVMDVEVRKRLRSKKQQLLNGLSFRSVRNVYDDPQQWKDFVDVRYKDIQQQQEEWQDVVRQAWNNVAEKIHASILREMLNIHAEAHDNTTKKEKAAMFVAEVDVVNKLMNEEQKREADYIDAAVLERRAKEEEFVMRVAYIDAIDKLLMDEEQTLEVSSDSTSIQPIESYVTKAYEVVRIEEQKSIQTIALASFWLLTTLTFSLLVTTLIQQPQQLFTVTLVCAVLVGLLCVGLLFRQHRSVMPTRNDELDKYHAYCLQECNVYEDTLRLKMLETLRVKLACMTSNFLTDIKVKFAEDVTHTIEQFFSTPAAIRDVFVCDEQHFCDKAQAKEELQKLVKKIEVSIHDTKQNMHRGEWFTEQNIKYLLTLFQDASLDVQDMREKYSQELNKNAQKVITMYLNANTSSHRVETAMNETLWKGVLARMQQPFSSIQTHYSQDKLVFLSGSTFAVKAAKLQQQDGIPISGQLQQLLVVTLYSPGIVNESAS